MGLETGTYISDLEPLNPASTDLLKQADDHLRLIKSVIKNTFPNITGPVTATQDEINSPASSVPVGAILVWYGASSAIPAGYALCDGSTVNRSDNSGTITTPNLVNRIPMGAGTTVAQGATAGGLTASGSTTATTANVTGTTDPAGAHSHDAGTYVAGAPTINLTTTSNTQVAQGGTGNCIITVSGTASTSAVTGTSGAVADHSHTFTGTADIGTLNIDISTLPPVLGLHYIMKI